MFTIYCGYGMLWIIIAFHSHMPWPLGHRGSPWVTSQKLDPSRAVMLWGWPLNTAIAPWRLQMFSSCLMFWKLFSDTNYLLLISDQYISVISQIPCFQIKRHSLLVASLFFRLNETSVDPEPNETVKPTPPPRSSEAVDHAMPRNNDGI